MATKKNGTCKCGMPVMDPWVCLYATRGEAHSRAVCVITSHNYRLNCHPWLPMEVQQHRAEKAVASWLGGCDDHEEEGSR